MASFIEVQFPVSKISKESYKERKSQQFQTLTQLGKWWGPKPLILVRAAVLGLLLPATDNPVKDREIFLKLLTMDEDGLWRRKKSNVPINEIIEYLTPKERDELFDQSTGNRARYRSGISRDRREQLQKIVFLRMDYGKKIKYCLRPEEIDGPSNEAWNEINAHLSTHARSFPDLTKELGMRQFGGIPRVGDCFCGRGNIPFEAARLGCDAYASDLSPVAAMITWAAFNIIGGGDEVVQDVARFQKEVYDSVEAQIEKWGIERSKEGWRAYAYLYCNETVCPECGWKIPLLSSFVVAERMQKIVVELIPDPQNKRFEIQIKTVQSEQEIEAAKNKGTVIESQIYCPNLDCRAHSAPLSLAAIRREGQNGLRLWESEDIVPRKDDIFQERLYCIRWEEVVKNTDGTTETKWHFCIPTDLDLKNEARTVCLLEERLDRWKQEGYIPTMKIEPGEKTWELIRTRGWTFWHHLFSPRQLLYIGLLNEIANKKQVHIHEKVAHLLGSDKCLDYNSKLCHFDTTVDLPRNSFYNQALNTMYLYAGRGLHLLSQNWFLAINSLKIESNYQVECEDGRNNKQICSFWITDPPYADAINYHELSEFFISGFEKLLPQIFPKWIPDSRRALAIRGSGDDFKHGMVDAYRNLTQHMPDNGAQIVMFTHQDAGVWADLTLILWASGLKVTAAWCIATETVTGVRKGNYVQGTVLLILRKQTSDKVAFLDEIYPEIEDEVKRQLDSMTAIDDKEDPNFTDTDYQLAAYAAALRVLTGYKHIEGIDVTRELARTRTRGKISELEKVIREAVKIACNHLIPRGIEGYLWRQLTAEEKFYLKGLELESHGEFRTGAYQELARGFGIREYRPFLATTKANDTRLKTASEFRSGDLGGEGFGGTILRKVLFAIRQTTQTESTDTGRMYFRSELAGLYWDKRKDIIELLKYLALLEHAAPTAHWKEDAHTAALLAGAIEQDHI